MVKRLQELRKSKNLSQRELSEILNVQRNTISRYENGNREPDYDTLCKLADFFDVSSDYLLGLSNDPTPPDAKKAPAVLKAAEALRMYAESKKGGPLTQEELNRLDDFADTFIKGLNK